MKNASSILELPKLSMFSMAFRAYADPIMCLMAIFGNIGVLIAMARVHERSINRNVRFYYSLLAIDELLMVGICVFVFEFLEIGIAYFTSGGQNYPILTVDASVWSCKLLEIAFEGSYIADGFLLVCIGFERLIAITWPLRSRTLLSLSFSVILTVGVVGGVLALLLPKTALVYTLTPVGCTYNLDVFFAIEYIAFESILPMIHSLLSFSFTTYLVVKLVRSKRARNGLVEGAGAAISAHEVSNVLTLLAIDVSHLVMFIPYVFVAGYGLVSMALTDALAVDIYPIVDIFYAVRPVPYSITFFIHFFRSAHFRVALCGRRLF